MAGVGYSFKREGPPRDVAPNEGSAPQPAPIAMGSSTNAQLDIAPSAACVGSRTSLACKIILYPAGVIC